MERYPLAPSHIHQAHNRVRTGDVTLWPSVKPGLWYVRLNTGRQEITREPVSEDRVYDLLEEWEVELGGPWLYWPGKLWNRHPYS
jgi:hypothetical protein